MSKPTLRDVHVDTALSNFAVNFTFDDFVSDKVFPSVPVAYESDKYYVWDRGDFFRAEAARRAPGTAAKRASQGLSNATYTLEEWALSDTIIQREIDNADSVLSVRLSKVEYLKNNLMLRRELEWAADFFATGVWGTDVTISGGSQWNNYATSSPLADLETGRATIQSKTGKFPNTLILGYQAWQQLKYHPDFLTALNHVGKGIATLADVRAMTEIPNIYIGSAIQTTSAEGVTDAYGRVWGKSGLLMYVAPRVGINTPTAGVCFKHKSRYDRVRRWTDDELEAEVIEHTLSFDDKVTVADMGYFLATVVA